MQPLIPIEARIESSATLMKDELCKGQGCCKVDVAPARDAMLRLSFSTTQQPYGGSILANLNINKAELHQANHQQRDAHARHAQEVGPVHAEENRVAIEVENRE